MTSCCHGWPPTQQAVPVSVSVMDFVAGQANTNQADYAMLQTSTPNQQVAGTYHRSTCTAAVHASLDVEYTHVTLVQVHSWTHVACDLLQCGHTICKHLNSAETYFVFLLNCNTPQSSARQQQCRKTHTEPSSASNASFINGQAIMVSLPPKILECCHVRQTCRAWLLPCHALARVLA
jgi:hypothetical protein